MGEKKLDNPYTIQEYLQFENQATDAKHEFDNGEVLAMTGGSINHSRISSNVLYSLTNEIRTNSKGCEAFNADIRIFIEKANAIVYPDVALVCGPIETQDEDEETITNPSLVIEVLSKSTAGYDRGKKFYKYRMLNSLKEYILIDQYHALVDAYRKQDNGEWLLNSIVGLDKKLMIHTLNFSLPLQEIYRNIPNISVP